MVEYVRSRLIELSEESYGDFQARLMPNVEREKIIGIRTPILRRLASELSRHECIGEFLGALPHEYYEENNLHAFLIERIKDYDTCIAELDRFLPYVDNWATCDSMRPKIFAKNSERLTADIQRWIQSEHTYTVRFGIEMLMCFYLDGEFKPEYNDWVAGISSEEYYIRMMQAWYFATALAKQPEETLPYIEAGRLEAWTHNKTVQKARESYRISDEMKKQLKTLKREI